MTRRPSAKPSGRAAVKRDAVVDDLRRRIVSGRLAPGARLPDRLDLIGHFDLSPLTVQSAIDRLRREGFVRAVRGRGTFVAAHPPHLSRYALVFRQNRVIERWTPWSHFYETLYTVAASLSTASREIACYCGLDGHTDAPDYQRLLADLRSQRLAGVLFVSEPWALAGTPILEAGGPPCVTIAGEARRTDRPLVNIDQGSFYKRAVATLAGHGRRRVAVVSTPMNDAMLRSITRAFTAHGLKVRPPWLLEMEPHATRGVSNAVRLLMDYKRAAERPDGLIVTDDHLVEAVGEGLAAAAVRVPRDLEIIAHANFPMPPKPCVPMALLGFDSRQVLSQAFAVLDALRAGRHVAAATSIGAQFEEGVP